MSLLDDEIKKFVDEQAELGCWNSDFEYRLRRALIRYHTLQSQELRERVKELEEKNRGDGSRWAKDRIEQGKKHESDMMEACGRIVELEDRIKELDAKIASYESAIDGLKKVVDSLVKIKSI